MLPVASSTSRAEPIFTTMRRACSSAFSACFWARAGVTSSTSTASLNSPSPLSRSAFRAASRCFRTSFITSRIRSFTPVPAAPEMTRGVLRDADFSAFVFAAISVFDRASHLFRQTISGLAASFGL